jgi:hypothetical protein
VHGIRRHGTGRDGHAGPFAQLRRHETDRTAQPQRLR